MCSMGPSTSSAKEFQVLSSGFRRKSEGLDFERFVV